MRKVRALYELVRSASGGKGDMFTHVMRTTDSALVAVTRVLRRMRDPPPVHHSCGNYDTFLNSGN